VSVPSGGSARPVSVDLSRRMSMTAAAAPTAATLGRPTAPLPRKLPEVEAALRQHPHAGVWWVSSLDGGVGRTSVALALALTLARHRSSVAFIDADQRLHGTDTPRRLGRPGSMPEQGWAWTEPTPAGVHPLAASWAVHVDLIAAASELFRCVVIDLPAGVIPTDRPGHHVLVARTDEHHLERVGEFVQLAHTDLVVATNPTVSQRSSRRATQMLTAIAGWTPVVTLPTDPAIATSSVAYTDLAANTALAAGHLILHTERRATE